MIHKRDNYECNYCGSHENLTIDHIIPASRGGMDTWENLTSCCVSCNGKKGSRTPEEANMTLRSKPKIPFNRVQLTIQSSNIPDWRNYIYA
jgi:5-methylcytosine-specific restriction endonuclease McrA